MKLARLGKDLGGPCGLAVSPDGVWLASGHEGAVILWDLASGQALHRLEGHAGQVCGLAFSPDGQTLASSALGRQTQASSALDEDVVRLWDVPTGQALKTLTKDPECWVHDLAFTRDGATLVGTLRGWSGWSGVLLWDIATEQARQLNAPIRDIDELALSPDGRRLAIGSADGSVVVQDLASGQLVLTLSAEERYRSPRLDFSPDGTRLASGVLEWMQVWDVDTGQLLGKFEGNGASFSPDNALVAILESDDTVLWDVAAKREIGRLPHAWHIVFSPDRRRLVLGSPDDVLTLWGVKTPAGGPYTPDEHTLLLLHFDGYYAGTQDEPGAAQGTSFAAGAYDQGVLIDNADTLTYTTAGNLNPEAGTIEFWVRPGWDGDDGQMHIFFETAPADYGIQIGKDGVGNLQFIIWTPAGVHGVGRSLLDWQAGEWHHLAAVWDRTGMAVFIDGQEADSNQAATPPEAIGGTFFVGTSPDLGWQADAVIDELRISDVPRLGIGEGYPGRTPSAQETPAEVGRIELTGPLLVDSQAGRLYASGRVGEEPKTLVLAATDGRLLATYDITGLLALDSVHGWLIVDRDDEGLAVLDAQTGALQASIPLPDREVLNKAYARPGPGPQADPATGQVLAFRDNVVYVADPEKGLVTRTIPFDIPKAEDCRTLSGPLPIEWATYDSARRFLYLDFETYVCTPWFSHTLVSYDMASGSEIARSGVPPVFSATAFDGYLYGSSWFRMGDGHRWAWRDGRPWFGSSGWSYGAPGLEVDPTRQRLYAQYTGGIHVFDARTMALLMIAPLPVNVQGFAGYDPKTDQLYSLVNGELRPWPASAIQPPTPEPLSASQPPTTSVRSLLVSPTWVQDKTLFGIWNARDPLGECWVFGGFGGPLYVSDDGGSTWSRPRGGLPDECEDFSALAVSPDYARDRTLLAGVIGLGLFRSSDGGQLWEPSSAGLLSMNIEQILLSPGFARDGTAFARVSPAGERRGVHRSRDGGRSWQALDVNLNLVAMSPEFDQDHTLMGVAVSYVDQEQRSELHISRDGGDHWERAGNVPAGKGVGLLSLAPLFARWQVLFAHGYDGTLYRSADGGSSWDAVLSDLPAAPTQLVYAPGIEVNRPVFLVAVETLPDQPAILRGRLYRSGDGGLTWQALELPEDVSPTALAISPNFAQDGLLFVGTADGRVLAVEDWRLTGQGR